MGDRAFRWGLLGTARINRMVIPPSARFRG